MNDVVTAAKRSPRVLVTGFGPFPGAPVNPTLDMLRHLEADGVAEVDLVFARLPVTFAGVGPALHEAARCRPDAMLLLGLAKRRRILHVETLARNVAGHATCDIDGQVPEHHELVAGAAASYAATWPAATILAALRRSGHAATLSTDAGDYVCNAALFHALRGGLAPRVGFLHVPPVRDRPGRTVEALADAARLAVGALTSPERAPPQAAIVGPQEPGRTR